MARHPGCRWPLWGSPLSWQAAPGMAALRGGCTAPGKAAATLQAKLPHQRTRAERHGGVVQKACHTAERCRPPPTSFNGPFQQRIHACHIDQGVLNHQPASLVPSSCHPAAVEAGNSPNWFDFIISFQNLVERPDGISRIVIQSQSVLAHPPEPWTPQLTTCSNVNRTPSPSGYI